MILFYFIYLFKYNVNNIIGNVYVTCKYVHHVKMFSIVAFAFKYKLDILKVHSHGAAAAMAILPQWDESVHTVWQCLSLEFFLNGAELSLNSVNSEKLINH